MSFFESLKRFFTGNGENGRSGEPTSSGRSSSPDETGATTIPCDEACARLFEYLDGELDGVPEEEVRHHLEICEGCYPRVQFEKHFLEALRQSQDGGRVSDSLRQRVLRSLAEDGRLD